MWTSCVWASCVWTSWVWGRRRVEEAGGSAQPKTRTPHKDVGNKILSLPHIELACSLSDVQWGVSQDLLHEFVIVVLARWSFKLTEAQTAAGRLRQLLVLAPGACIQSSFASMASSRTALWMARLRSHGFVICGRLSQKASGSILCLGCAFCLCDTLSC